MVNLLFNPQGRIGPGPFWQGVIILLVASCLLNVLSAYGPQSLFLVLSLVSLVIGLIYSSLCVYGKRLHDAGKSAWWFILILIGGWIASAIVGSFAARLLVGAELAQIQTQMQESMAGGAPGPEFFALLRRSIQVQFLPSVGASVVVTLVVAFFVARLKSDPAENRFGPPTASAAPAAA